MSTILSTKQRWPIAAAIATPIGLGRRDARARMVVMAERSHFITSLVVEGDASYIGCRCGIARIAFPGFIEMIWGN